MIGVRKLQRVSPQRCDDFYSLGKRVFQEMMKTHFVLAEVRMEFWKWSFRVNETIGLGKMYVWRKRNECFPKLGRPRGRAGGGPGPAQRDLGWRREMMPRTSGAA